MAEETGEVKNQEWRGKVGKMTEDEFVAFLAGNPFCRIGCVDEEGWPYVVPCWFEYKDGGFYIIPRAKSAWARYIQKDRRVFLSKTPREGSSWSVGKRVSKGLPTR